MIFIAKSGRDILQQQTYPFKTFFQTRRISWPIMLSVALHLSFTAALIYASIKTLVHLPEPAEQESIKAIMVNPAMFSAAKTETTSKQKSETPAAKPETKPETEPKTANNAEAKTKPVVKPPVKVAVKPKPLKKEQIKPKLVEKALETPVREQRITESRPKENNQSLFSSRNESHSLSASTASSSNNAVKASAPSSASLGPKAISRGKPTYPPRAYALKIEGKVKVRYDVDSNGSVSNIEIVSAEPSNMFEREVKQAMKKWRYEPGRAGKGISSTFYFRMDGGTSVN